MKQFYAVAKGRTKGVYGSWAECKAQIDGYIGARYKKFGSEPEALRFINCGGSLILGQLGIMAEEVPREPRASPTSTHNTPHSLYNTAYPSAPNGPSHSQHKPDDLVCFSDGSCIHNGKINARGGFSCVFPNHPELTHSEPLPRAPSPTNNRAEYSALIKAIQIAERQDATYMKPLYFYTDSQLLIDTATKWIAGWKRKGWKKADGTTVMNLDLVKRIDELMQSPRKVVFKHVDAHTGRADWASVWNDKADELAKAATAAAH